MAQIKLYCQPTGEQLLPQLLLQSYIAPHFEMGIFMPSCFYTFMPSELSSRGCVQVQIFLNATKNISPTEARSAPRTLSPSVMLARTAEGRWKRELPTSNQAAMQALSLLGLPASQSTLQRVLPPSPPQPASAQLCARFTEEHKMLDC